MQTCQYMCIQHALMLLGKTAKVKRAHLEGDEGVLGALLRLRAQGVALDRGRQRLRADLSSASAHQPQYRGSLVQQRKVRCRSSWMPSSSAPICMPGRRTKPLSVDATSLQRTAHLLIALLLQCICSMLPLKECRAICSLFA